MKVEADEKRRKIVKRAGSRKNRRTRCYREKKRVQEKSDRVKA